MTESPKRRFWWLEIDSEPNVRDRIWMIEACDEDIATELAWMLKGRVVGEAK